MTIFSLNVTQEELVEFWSQRALQIILKNNLARIYQLGIQLGRVTEYSTLTYNKSLEVKCCKHYFSSHGSFFLFHWTWFILTHLLFVTLCVQDGY